MNKNPLKYGFFLFLLFFAVCPDGAAQDAWTCITQVSGKNIGYVNDIQATRKGEIWIYSHWRDPETEQYEVNVFRFRNNEWSIETAAIGEYTGYMSADPEGNIWFYSYNAIAKYDDDSLHVWETSFHPLSLAVAADGTVWCGSATGVYRFDGSIWTNYTTKDGLPSNAAFHIVISPAGEPWVRFGDTYQIDGYIPASGVSLFHNGTWMTYDETNGLRDNLVDDIAFDPDGGIYVSTAAGGLYSGISRFDGDSWEFIPNQGGKLIFDANGNLWITDYWSGKYFYKYDGNSLERHFFPEGVDGRFTTGAQLYDGKLLFGIFTGVAMFDPDSVTAVAGENGMPSSPPPENHPNPFNSATTITYTLPTPSTVTISVYTCAGQNVAVLADGLMPAGTHSVVFDGSNLSSGVYFYRVLSPGFAGTGKMLLVK